MESTVHQHLKHQAVLWLKDKMTDLCAAEVKLSIQRRKRTADAVGINMKRKESRIIEVKATRQDFLRDDVLKSDFGYHAVSHYAYILTPEGLLNKNDIPAGYGLLEADRYDRITVVKRPVKNKKPALKLETLIKRTGRAATNAYLFQQESRLSKDETDGVFKKKPIAHLVRATCPECKKRRPYVLPVEAKAAVCTTPRCQTIIELSKARPFHTASYNQQFLNDLHQALEKKEDYS